MVVNQDTVRPIDPSITWESSGILANASSQGALFSLYMAMFEHGLADPFRIESPKLEKPQQSELDSLKHYRRPRLQASESDWNAMYVLSQLMSSDIDTARLYQAMYPQPLAQTDDKNRLPDDVINNCTLGAQKRIKNLYNNVIQEDNTLLYDIISNYDTPYSSANASNQQATESIFA